MFKFNKKNGIGLAIIFSILFLFSLVSAVAPITEVSLNFASGFEIAPAYQNAYEQNTGINVNFFLYNKTNGFHITNSSVSCIYYLADNHGTLLSSINVPYSSANYWTTSISGGNFSRAGEYNYGIKCNSSIQGGAFVGIYTINSMSDLNQTSYNLYLFLGIIAFLILIIGIATKTIPMTILGGFAITLVGLYSLNNGIAGNRTVLTQWISIILMIFGGLWSVIASLEYLEESK